MFFINDKPTPILNTPYFSDVYGESLPFDDEMLVRAVEMIALPNMIFHVVGKKGGTIIEVTTENYPSPIPLYVDSRFGTFCKNATQIERQLPSPEVIIERMKKNVGLPYIWGGNYSKGIPEWKKFYPPQKKLSPFEEAHWTFHGLDCSGILYEATEGCTPRNTSEMMTYGKEVSLEDIKPLDLILYPGHVVIAIENSETIESQHSSGGVVIRSLEKRLSKISGPYLLRRFHPAFF
ncbi:MAG: C40 family peptidase [Chlamydiales bacterium]|nr:C40 family peptidase [Chlamydiales bacterium]